jgi:hypothetical protein
MVNLAKVDGMVNNQLRLSQTQRDIEGPSVTDKHIEPSEIPYIKEPFIGGGCGSDIHQELGVRNLQTPINYDENLFSGLN